jgi:hypothetical protein
MNVATTVQEAPRVAAPWIERTARIGYAAKGLLYLVTAGLAIATAVGVARTVPTGQTSAMRTLIDIPFGQILVGIIAVGLVGYGVWRIVMAIVDLEDDGRSLKGLAVRFSYACRGVFHLALAYSACKAIMGITTRSKAADEKQLSATALAIPGGRFVLIGVAIGIAIYAGYELYCAVTSKLSSRLDLGRLSQTAQSALVGLARFGIAARAMIFLTLAWFIGQAALLRDASKAGGVAESTQKLFSLGTLPYLAVALGLAGYGVYQLVEARFRRISVA